MMKNITTLGLALLLCIGIASQAGACLSKSTYLGTFDGNDNDITQVLNNILDSAAYTGVSLEITEFSFYAKVDAPDRTTTEGTGDLSICYSGSYKSGRWKTYSWPDSEGPLLDFYSVKAGNQYALYWLPDATDSGSWNTGDLMNNGGQIPTISHLSTWTINTTAVPVPATILLMGSGLFALLGYRRKRLG